MAKEYIEERNGGLYLAGTRVSVNSILQCFDEGMSPESILEEFDTLTLAQIYGAIAYCLENRPAVDALRMRQRLRSMAQKASATPVPEDLRQRLVSARERLALGSD